MRRLIGMYWRMRHGLRDLLRDVLEIEGGSVEMTSIDLHPRGK